MSSTTPRDGATEPRPGSLPAPTPTDTTPTDTTPTVGVRDLLAACAAAAAVSTPPADPAPAAEAPLEPPLRRPAA